MVPPQEAAVTMASASPVGVVALDTFVSGLFRAEDWLMALGFGQA